MAGSDSDAPPAGRQVPSPSPAVSAGDRRADDVTDVVLRADGIAKSFGVTRAVVDCSLDVRAGEVHVLMGENGSGKSTLVKILSGVHRPDAGSVTAGRREHPFLASPRAATAARIVTVFQEILVTPQRSVLANAWLGSDGLLRRGQTIEERRARATDVISRLIDPVDLDIPIEQLGLNDRQAICIARALLRDPRILILDEATSALDITTRDNLFALIAELCAGGVGVLFISHRMDEVERIGDRVTVMRSGENVATGGRGEFTSQELVRLMIGSEQVMGEERLARHRSSQVEHSVTLRVTGVKLHGAARPINAEFRSGEIVGVAGLEGHGQDAFLQVLSGTLSGEGQVLAVGPAGEHGVTSRAAALDAGIAYVPRNRRDEALFPTLSVLENFGIATTGEDQRAGLVNRRSTARRFRGFVDSLKIRAARPGNAITTLSGGNQQKVIIARWLALRPGILLLNDPTRGVDVAAKSDIYAVLADAAAEGVTIIMLTTELIELVELMDRVLVFREGELFRELARDEVTRTNLVASYFGRELS
jgi:ABC-type sugar transport system ATPase subunit